MNRFYLYIILFISLSVVFLRGGNVYSQSKESKLDIEGKVYVNGSKFYNGVVQLYQEPNNKEDKPVTVSLKDGAGNFVFSDLLLNKIYYLRIVSSKYYNKFIEINTNVPEPAKKGLYLKVVVEDLTEKIKGLEDADFFKKPFMKFAWDEEKNEFTEDKEYSKDIEIELAFILKDPKKYKADLLKAKADKEEEDRKLEEVERILDRRSEETIKTDLVPDNTKKKEKEPVLTKNDKKEKSLEEQKLKEEEDRKIAEAQKIKEERAKEEAINKILSDSISDEEIVNKYNSTQTDYKDYITNYQALLNKKTESGDKRISAAILNQMGVVYKEQGENTKALECFNKSLKIYQELNSKLDIATSLHYIGNVYYAQSDNEKALTYFDKTLNLYEELGDKKGMAMLYNNIGVIYDNWGRYEKAIEYYQKALKLKEELGDAQGVAILNNIIGNVYYEFDKEKSLDFYKKSLELDIKNGDKKDVAASYNNMGVVFYDLGKYEEAIDYYQKSLTLKEELGNKEGIAVSLNNIGNVYYDWSKYEKSIEYYQKAVEIKGKLNNEQAMAISFHNIGNAFKKLVNYEKAIDYYDKSNSIAKKFEMKELLSRNYEAFTDVYTATQDYKKALEYYRLYAELKFSISDEEKGKQMNEMDMKYETERKQQELKFLDEIQLLNKERELKDLELNKMQEEIKKQRLVAKYEKEKKEKEKELSRTRDLQIETELKRKNILIISSLIGICLVLLLVFVIYSRYRVKRKSNILLEQQNKEILEKKQEIESQKDKIERQNSKLEIKQLTLEHALNIVEEKTNLLEIKNKDITDSIRYAKRIQNSILPSDKVVNKLLPNSFVLYKPKDILSGDFYWIEQYPLTIFSDIIDTSNPEYLIVAAADCTGHGVPGALMSIVGHNMLNRALADYHHTRPSDILKVLDDGVNNALRQKEDHANAKDGMDIALISYEISKKRLQYAGAKNPLYLVRNNNLRIIRADRMPIGSYSDNGDKEFTNKEFTVLEGDIVYIFSDGYADQFGGPKGKKFKYSSFRELLLSVHTKPLEEQKNILNETIETWKGTNEQADDILVIGIKF